MECLLRRQRPFTSDRRRSWFLMVEESVSESQTLNLNTKVGKNVRT
jgi:hypothetical protein